MSDSKLVQKVDSIIHNSPLMEDPARAAIKAVLEELAQHADDHTDSVQGFTISGWIDSEAIRAIAHANNIDLEAEDGNV